MFYNVENFFDYYNDSLTQDDEFLPDGDRHWNYSRFTDKLKKIYKVIIAIGGSEAPEIIGLCEIENRYVLNKLIFNTPLSKYEYEIVHQDSPDSRGIDVALLFRKDKLELLQNSFLNISFPWNPLKKTRDILYFKGLTKGKDTLHIFINHWPSRYKGQLETESYRVYVASVLKNKVDSIFNTSKDSHIIIAGDFNDEPQNKSIKEILSAETDISAIKSNKLYNLSYLLSDSTKTGTVKYKFIWEMFDQFIVSGSLLDTIKISTTSNDIHIFSPDFLLEEDNKYMGYRPFRTYRGYKYTGGYSDHLPVYLDIF
jgi:predicted extracellular nuclease